MNPINPAVALLPFSPVGFTSGSSLYAWGRLILYGGAAVILYDKHKTAAMVLGGAALLSLLTSLTAPLPLPPPNPLTRGKEGEAPTAAAAAAALQGVMPSRN